MGQVTVGELLVRCLKAEGVEMMSGIIDGAHVPIVAPLPARGIRMRWAGKAGAPRSVSTTPAIRLARLLQFAGRLRGRPSEASPQTMLMLSKAHSVSIGKARRLLGYAPRVDLAEGLRRTEAWLRAEGLI